MSSTVVPLETAAPPRLSPQLLLGALALAVLSAALAWLSNALAGFEGGVSALWLANGLLVGVLLSTPRPQWRWWFLATALGQAAARLGQGDTWWLALLLVAINLVESGIIAVWVRRRSDALGEGSSLGGMARDALAATVLASAVSAALAAPLLVGHVETSLPLALWSWCSSHVMGMVVMATLTVCALQPNVGLLGRVGMRLDYALCLSLLLVVCCVVFWQDRYPLLFVTYLPLLFLVWRHGLSGMMMGVVVVAGVSGIAEAQDSGPFALLHGASPLSCILLWQMYVAAGCVLAYSTAIAMAQQRRLEKQLLRSEARHRQLAEEAERLARFDSLTGLANRRHFDEHLAEAVVRAGRNDTALLLLALDLDHFKQINDSLGHAGGDAVLQEFARRLRETVFDVDLVARLGGDEFVVLVEYTPTADAGVLIAERVLRAMREPFIIDGVVKLDVGTSIGIGLDSPVVSASRLMQVADKALYQAKAKGRNTWALCGG